MTDISSETILRAAELMRGRAVAATAPPWTASPVWSLNGTVTSAVYSHAHPAGSTASEVVASGRIRPECGGIRNPNDVVHIAGMDPSVVLAMAAWLESCGKALAGTGGDYLSSCDEPGAVEAAFKIARTYLGEAA